MRNFHRPPDKGFIDNVESWVECALREGAEDFNDLIRKLPGVYPTEAYQAIMKLGSTGALAPDKVALLEPNHEAMPNTNLTPNSLLPLPHPLNYEWRFNSQSSHLLLDLAEELCEKNNSILLFGTPNVALESIYRPRYHQITFVGENNPVTRRLIALNEMSGDPISISAYNAFSRSNSPSSVIVLDPPWYMDFILPMLAASTVACMNGGHVLISLPPEGTRPTAAEELERTINYAKTLGLSHIATHNLSLVYETPFFEANSLAANRMFIDGNWRRGDLVVFRKSENSSTPVLTTSQHETHWREIEIERMRLFIRTDTASDEQHYMQSIVEGDVLPSVSRRDPRRNKAHIWTSGNRVFASSNPQAVLSAALMASGEKFDSHNQALSHGKTPSLDEIERLSYLLKELASVEAKEERQHVTSGSRKGGENGGRLRGSAATE